MAHKKGVGSTRNGRDSHSKRLGVKLFGGQTVRAGNIIIRQRGTRFHPGEGVGIGKDHTIFATTDGVVAFTKKRNKKSYVSVLSEEVLKAQPETQPSSEKSAPEGKKGDTKKSEAKKDSAKKGDVKEKSASAKKDTKATKTSAAKKPTSKKPAKKAATSKKDSTKSSSTKKASAGKEGKKGDNKE